jgi:flagellar biosynthesis protein FlhA
VGLHGTDNTRTHKTLLGKAVALAVDTIGSRLATRWIHSSTEIPDSLSIRRIKGVRRTPVHDPWFRVRTAQIYDNLDMAPNGHRIFRSGTMLAEAVNYPDKELAINLGQVFGSLAGIPTKNPAFGVTAA